jgi:diaminohydroxyphosphoribosylaminopyrimidine deaminase/5-amino-6-(5-phosphoribosylamino)uracil reductase
MNHEYFMQMAFDLALKGTGHTGMNPLVGAVIVRDGIILGSGFHQKYGGHHAEVNAILNAKAFGHEVSGATLYCNLEPCSHTKKQTPPCTSLIIKEKIARVIISTLDPNPQVSGGGVRLLRSQGIEVIEGILYREGLRLNEVFFKFITKEMPFVHLKMAQSLDGRVATKNGESKYITGPESLKRVHALRQKYDSIMVGRKTLELDNPSLTTRSDEFSEISHPTRVIIGKLKHLNLDWKIFCDDLRSRTIVVTTKEDANQNKAVSSFLETKGVSLLLAEKNDEGRVNLTAMLKSLAKRNITSLLLEGGPQLATEFLKLKLVDKVSFFIAPVIIGAGRNSIEDLGILELENKLKLEKRKIEILGNDILVEGYLCSPV